MGTQRLHDVRLTRAQQIGLTNHLLNSKFTIPMSIFSIAISFFPSGPDTDKGSSYWTNEKLYFYEFDIAFKHDQHELLPVRFLALK